MILLIFRSLMAMSLGVPLMVYIYTERQKSCTTFSFNFFWIEIDDYENQCSIVSMPVQKTIVVEKIKCV